MRDVFLSNCEKSFLQKLVSEGHRLDGRNYYESRNLEISFGSEFGSCIVSLGETNPRTVNLTAWNVITIIHNTNWNTLPHNVRDKTTGDPIGLFKKRLKEKLPLCNRVQAQVSCEVVQPKQIRPNEGILYINVELGPMAAPQFEANRQTDLSVYLNRLLEKCYKDSKCIDLESLCIVVEEKVWSLRVDIKVLNHAGNLIECASIATLTSLAHFKRPDVTRSGDSVIIHTLVEKDPIPTVLYHYPVCLTFAIFGNDIIISDPSFIEESVCTSSSEGVNAGGGLLVVGMNQYRELCLLNLTGAAIHSTNVVYKATQSAAERCKDIVDIVKKAIIRDDTLRQNRVKINFSDIITQEHVLSLSLKDLNICLKNYNRDDLKETVEDEEMFDDEKPEPSKYDVVQSLPQIAEIKAKKRSAWIEISSDSDN